MARAAITRRRALALGAAAGAGTLLARIPAPALAAARAIGFGLTVSAGDFSGGVSRVLAAPRRFDIVGLRGSRQDVEVRVRRRGGRWSRWVRLAVHGDHAPDTGSGERASDPVWTGGSDELQLRARRPVRGSLRLHFVTVPAGATRGARVGARAASAAHAAQAPGGVATPPPIIPRAAWGGDQVPPRVAPSYGQVLVAFVHHTVTANDYTADQSASIVLGIAKYHRDTNGWNDIGYNFLVDQFGQVFEGRAGGTDQAVIGAHAQGYNRVSTGVAVLGTYTAAPISEAAMQSLAQLLGWKLSLHGVPTNGLVTVTSGGGSDNRYPNGTLVTLNRISGHRDGDATSCPGDVLYGELPTLRERAAGYAGPVAPVPMASLQASATQVLYGDSAQFSGLVRNADGTAVVNQPVTVQKRGRTRWSTVARAVTDGQGAWATGVPWRATGSVRAVAAGIASEALTVTVLPKVDARAIEKHVAAGATLPIAGRVRPASPVYVLVERKGSDGKWRRSTVVRGRVRLTSFSAAVRLKSAGLYRLTPKAGSAGASTAAAPLYVRAVAGVRARRSAKTGGTSY